MPPLILHHTPLPPARNGIADYAVRMIDSLRPHFKQAVRPYGEAVALDGIAMVQADLAKAMPIYQIGNNWQHTDILLQALQRPGVVVLHDLQLFYLYESTGQTPAQTLSLMRRSNPFLGAGILTDMLHKQPTPKLPYLLCNMLGEVVERAHAVVVHSDFAKRYIARHFGADTAAKVSVIPHFAISGQTPPAADLKTKYGYGAQTCLVVTAGFASRAKCFDQIAAAVAALRREGLDMVWIHAGDPQHGDVDLRQMAKAHPELDNGFVATGYLDEQALDEYVAMADILLNLRFPTVGESSGSLARALAAGACTMVSDTGSYGEIPDTAVVHFPALGTVAQLKAQLRGLAQDTDLRARLSVGAKHYAAQTLALDRYGQLLSGVIRHAQRRARRAALQQAVRRILWPGRNHLAHADWFDVSTPQGREALAQAQSMNPAASLSYSRRPRGKRSGNYIGVQSHAE